MDRHCCQRQFAEFDRRFSRYRGLLDFIARRILDDERAAEEAVQGCWLAASRNPPLSVREGVFRSWLVRILIDEALIRRGSTGPQACSRSSVFDCIGEPK